MLTPLPYRCNWQPNRVGALSRARQHLPQGRSQIHCMRPHHWPRSYDTTRHTPTAAALCSPCSSVATTAPHDETCRNSAFREANPEKAGPDGLSGLGRTASHTQAGYPPPELLPWDNRGRSSDEWATSGVNKPRGGGNSGGARAHRCRSLCSACRPRHPPRCGQRPVTGALRSRSAACRAQRGRRRPPPTGRWHNPR